VGRLPPGLPDELRVVRHVGERVVVGRGASKSGDRVPHDERRSVAPARRRGHVLRTSKKPVSSSSITAIARTITTTRGSSRRSGA
jgi:hypothetical protein